MKAYRANKMVGYVFAPEKYVPIVNLASKIAFAEEMSVSMTPTADRLTKTSGVNGKLREAVLQLSNRGLISKETYLRLAEDEEQYIRIFSDMIAIPERIDGATEVRSRLSKELSEARPRGYSSSEVEIISKLIDEVLRFIDVSYKSGGLKNVKPGAEIELQKQLLSHLRSRDLNVTEGEKLGGGEADLLVNEELIIENKILRDPIDNPLDAKINAGWQARRYSHATLREIVFTVIGYVPLTENGLVVISRSVKAIRVGASETVEVRFCVPVGYKSPSKATTPNQ